MQKPVAMLAMMICCAAASGDYVPPQGAVVADRVAEAITNDLSAGRMSDAVERIQSLVLDDNAKYVRVEGRLLSVKLWVESLLGERREAFVAQYEKSLGLAASTELSAAGRGGSTHAITRVAARYPWTDAARRAPEVAARAAIARGDVASAKALVSQLGTSAVSPELQKLTELPSDSVLPHAAFSAGWYRSFFPALEPRAIPVASKDLHVVATSRSVVALAANGKPLWTTGEPAALKLKGVSRGKTIDIPTPKDESLSRPVVWCDLAGTPRVVIARIVEAEGAYLQAYHATDGRLLWSTADEAATRELVMTGAPAAAGGYVYFNAVRFDTASGLHAILGALDLMTGKLVWMSDVGELSRGGSWQRKKDEPEVEGPVRGIVATAGDSTEVSVDAHHVYAVLGPWVVAVDRFNGQPAWFATYPARPLDEKQLERERKSKTPPLYKRWRDVALSDGKTVVVAPIDSDLVLGLDVMTGREKWKEDGLRGNELVGVVDGRALFSGASLTALEIGTGDVAWQNAIPDADFQGPAFVSDGFLGVVTGRGVAYFDAERGLAAQRKADSAPVFDNVLRQNPARQALQTARAIEYFDPANR